jgi:hypothetical protein
MRPGTSLAHSIKVESTLTCFCVEIRVGQWVNSSVESQSWTIFFSTQHHMSQDWSHIVASGCMSGDQVDLGVLVGVCVSMTASSVNCRLGEIWVKFG